MKNRKESYSPAQTSFIQVARCGNAVCPPLAEAMVRANLPEWHTVTIINMAQFHKAVAM